MLDELIVHCEGVAMPLSLARFAPWLGGRAARLAGGAAVAPMALSFQTAGDARLRPCDLRGVISGSPQARSSVEALSADGDFSIGMWDCTAGVFELHFDIDEQIHILEGEATIRSGGRAHELRPGSTAYFPRGSTVRWEIPRYVKKVYVGRSPSRSAARRFADRVIGKLRRVLGRNSA